MVLSCRSGSSLSLDCDTTPRVGPARLRAATVTGTGRLGLAGSAATRCADPRPRRPAARAVRRAGAAGRPGPGPLRRRHARGQAGGRAPYDARRGAGLVAAQRQPATGSTRGTADRSPTRTCSASSWRGCGRARDAVTVQTAGETPGRRVRGPPLRVELDPSRRRPPGSAH